MEAFDGRVLDGAVHAFDFAVGPWLDWLGQSVFDLIYLTNHVEPHLPCLCRVSVSGLLGELVAVVSEDLMDAIRDGLEQLIKNIPRGLAICFVHASGDCKFPGPINADEEAEFARRRLNPTC